MNAFGSRSYVLNLLNILRLRIVSGIQIIRLSVVNRGKDGR